MCIFINIVNSPPSPPLFGKEGVGGRVVNECKYTNIHIYKTNFSLWTIPEEWLNYLFLVAYVIIT
jgi:hypothetical protein